MVTEQQIREALTKVMDPELNRNVIELNMLRDLRINDGNVEFTLALTIPECPLRDQIEQNARMAVLALEGVKNVKVTLGAMSEEERNQLFGKSTAPQASDFNHIGRTVAIASGKGGVGKSSVTALLAVGLAKLGYKVGVLDADITGPSIPRLFGLREPPLGGANGILPPQTMRGIKVMSVNLLLPREDEAVIWRGPIVSKVIEQFWNEVVWGELDYLLIDLPPGTSDAPLTVMQTLPVAGIILVTTPQELSSMVVRKARRMAEQLNRPILGVIENMSIFICPVCGTQHELFGPSHVEEISDAPLLGRLAIDPQLTVMEDAGAVEVYETEETKNLVKEFLKVVPPPYGR